MAEILKYHVVAGRVYSEDALRLSAAPTVVGPSIAIIPTDGGANINGARLLQTDIGASNGVIHVIDRVLVPADAPATAATPATGQRSTAMTTLCNALKEGVPVYNSGHHEQCADIYMQAVKTVSSIPGLTMSAGLRNQVNQTLRSCPQMSSSTIRAHVAYSVRHQKEC